MADSMPNLPVAEDQKRLESGIHHPLPEVQPAASTKNSA